MRMMTTLLAIGLGTALCATASAGHPAPTTCPSGLGVATDYNLFVFDSFVGANADVGGWLAVGEDADLRNYGVGTSSTSGPSLSVGDRLDARSTQVYGGDAEVGGHCSVLGFNVLDGSLSCNDAGAFDAGDHESHYLDLSHRLGELAPNGSTVVHPWGGVSFTGTDPELNVFELDLDAMAFSGILNTYAIDVPVGATVVIDVLGDTTPLFRYAGMSLTGTTRSRVLWNLEHQTHLRTTGISVLGSVLAPRAHVDHDNGNIEGTLVARSVAGNGEYHDHPFDGTLPCLPPPEPACPTDGDLGVANPFNLFAMGSYSGWTADIQGRAAVGDDAHLLHMSIGTALGGGGTSLHVGHALSASSSQVEGSDVQVAGLCAVDRFTVLDGDLTCQDPTALDAGDHVGLVRDISAHLSALPTNGTTTITSWGGVQLVGSHPDLNVFTIDLGAASFAPWVSNLVSYAIDVPVDSTVVVNWVGPTGRLFKNAGFHLTGASPERIVHNLEWQSYLNIDGISVAGSILAPRATVRHDNGNIEGTLVAVDVAGMGEYHDRTFVGDICPDEAPSGHHRGPRTKRIRRR